MSEIDLNEFVQQVALFCNGPHQGKFARVAFKKPFKAGTILAMLGGEYVVLPCQFAKWIEEHQAESVAGCIQLRMIEERRWSRQKAQRVRKRNPHAPCPKCGAATVTEVARTDWDYTGYIVKRTCKPCGLLWAAGPGFAVDAQAVVWESADSVKVIRGMHRGVES